MIRRLLVLSLVIGFTSVAQADVVLEIVPCESTNPFNPSGVYEPNEVATMRIMARQTVAPDDHLIRGITLHFDASDLANLGIGSVTWASIAAGHFQDTDPNSGPAGVTNIYKSVADTDLGANPSAQLNLPGDGSAVLVASFDVTMPAGVGSYPLDIVNAAGATNDDKASVVYGFDCDAAPALCLSAHPDNAFPVTIHRAGGTLTGGSTTLQVINQQLAAAVPADGGVLPRTQKNIMSLDFAVAIGGGIPVFPATVGCDTLGITIDELLAGGATVSLNAADFECFQNDVDNTIFHVRDSAAHLVNKAWYRVTDANGNVLAGNPWEIDQRVGYGDADRNGITASADVGFIWGNRGVALLDSPFDIDGSGIVNSADVAFAWGNRGAGAPPALPTGHDCP